MRFFEFTTLRCATLHPLVTLKADQNDSGVKQLNSICQFFIPNSIAVDCLTFRKKEEFSMLIF